MTETTLDTTAATRAFGDIWPYIENAPKSKVEAFNRVLSEVYPEMRDAWSLYLAIGRVGVTELEPRIVEAIATCLDVPVTMIDESLRAFLQARERCERLARAERRIERATKERDAVAAMCADDIAALSPQARDLLASQRKVGR